MNFSKMTKSVAGFVSVVALSVSSVSGADLDPSLTPPGGITIDKAPIFLNIGWDDNTSSEGIEWARSLFDGKSNPDGTPEASSFYMNSSSLNYDDNLIGSINSLVTSNHEIGNHTCDHHEGLTNDYEATEIAKTPDDVDGAKTVAWNKMTKWLRNEATTAEWKSIVKGGIDTLVKYTNVTESDLEGFRSPFLEFGNGLFPALAELGTRYDCSVEENGQAISGGFEWNWPYTLDGGDPTFNEQVWKGKAANTINIDGEIVQYNVTIPSTPGLWELPSYALVIPDDATCSSYGISSGLRDRIWNKISWMKTDAVIHLTGFDYNMWNQAALNKAEVLGMLKYNLDLRISGNRAPFLFGAHSQYYVGNWAASNAPNATKEEMQECIVEFLNYARGKSEVRIVATNTVVDWMENPKELSEVVVEPSTGVEVIEDANWYVVTDDYASSGSEGTVNSETPVISALTKGVDNNIDDADENNDEYAYAQLSGEVLGNLDGVTHIEVIYSSDKAITIGLSGSDYGYSSAELAAGTDTTVQVAVADFSQSWGSASLNLADIKSVDFETTVEGTTNLTISSLKITGYTAPVIDAADTIETIDNSDFGFYAYHDEETTDSDASSSLSTDGGKVTFTYDLGNVGTYAAAEFDNDGFTLDTVVSFDLKYSSSVDMVFYISMGEDWGSYQVVLPASASEASVSLNVGEFTKPDGSSVGDLDMSKVATYTLAPVDGGDKSGTITLSSAKLVYTGDVVVAIGQSGSVSTMPNIAITGLTKQSISLSVPTAGKYSVNIYSINGQLLRSSSANLNVGVNSINWNSLNMASKMVVVQISGDRVNMISKALIK
jgi:hypothetical protein